MDRDNIFKRPSGLSHLFMLTQGYAVLDDPAMPIVGASGWEMARWRERYVKNAPPWGRPVATDSGD